MGQLVLVASPILQRIPRSLHRDLDTFVQEDVGDLVDLWGKGLIEAGGSRTLNTSPGLDLRSMVDHDGFFQAR